MDRLSWLQVRGMRSVAEVRLALGGLTVLIGENGAGKSTLVEAFEILRKAGRVTPDEIFGDVITRAHLGLDMLLRKGAPRLELALRIDDADDKENALEYSFALRKDRENLAVDDERLELVGPGGRTTVIARTASATLIHEDYSSGTATGGPNGPVKVQVQPPPADLALHNWYRNHRGHELHPAVLRVLRVLSAGEVHLPFETRPLWLSAEQQVPNPMRDLTIVDRATRLTRLGQNLTNCYAALKNSDQWAECVDFLRLGLGGDFQDVLLVPAARGRNDLQVKFTGLPEPVSVATLSDGNLSIMAFAALLYMNVGRSFLVIDEPETHLHPSVLARLTAELERLAERFPIIVATQSDRLLDALSAPEASTVVCDLDSRTRSTRALRLDPVKLAMWKDRYAGLGSIRAEGLLDLVLSEAQAE